MIKAVYFNNVNKNVVDNGFVAAHIHYDYVRVTLLYPYKMARKYAVIHHELSA